MLKNRDSELSSNSELVKVKVVFNVKIWGEKTWASPYQLPPCQLLCHKASDKTLLKQYPDQHTFVWTLWRWNPILFCSLINTTKPTAFHISSFMAIMSQRKAYIVSFILLQFSFSSVLSPQWIKISKYKYVWMVSGHSHNRSKRQAPKPKSQIKSTIHILTSK